MICPAVNLLLNCPSFLTTRIQDKQRLCRSVFLQINGFSKIKESIYKGFVSSSIVLEYDLSSDPDYERVLFLENLEDGA